MEPQYFTTDFNAWVTELMAEWKVLGASMAILDNQNTYTKGFGVLRPDGPAVTEHSLFNAASMSKSFISAALALLVDDDEKYPHVQWNTQISSMIRDDFVLQDPRYTEQVTIADILSHRTGVPGHEDSMLGTQALHPTTPQSVTRSLRHLPVNKPLRTKFQYSNLMYIAAAHLLESSTGEPLSKFLEERFWKPLGMDHTYPDVASIGRESEDSHNIPDQLVSSALYWNAQTSSYDEVPVYDAPYALAAGNIISNVTDWARWIRSLLEGTSGISDKSVAEMTKPHILVSEPQDSRSRQSADFYGMAWHIHYHRGYKVISHAGGVPGHLSYMMWIPERKWGFVVFGNADGMGWLCRILGWTLVDTVLGVPDHERFDWAKQVRSMTGNSDNIDKDNRPSRDNSQENVKNKWPAPLPLAAYTGRYTNPAYNELLLELRNEKLFIHAWDRAFPTTLTFEHVSGNFFLAEKAYLPRFMDISHKMRVKFELNTAGNVDRMGIEFESESEYIWFGRVE